MLRTFFAVTASSPSTSVYQVDTNVPHFTPVLFKVAGNGESGVQPGQSLPSNDRRRLAIADTLIFFDPNPGFQTGQPTTELDIPRCIRGGHTSGIVALFLDEEEAHNCFDGDDLQPYDERWMSETQKVLDAIGTDHPTFSIFPKEIWHLVYRMPKEEFVPTIFNSNEFYP